MPARTPTRTAIRSWLQRLGIDEQYLHRVASEALSGQLGNSLTHAKSRELAQRLIDFVRDAADISLSGYSILNNCNRSEAYN